MDQDLDTVSPSSERQKDITQKNQINKKRNKGDKIKLSNSDDMNKMKKKKQKFARKAKPSIYIGHIPHGFYEDEMEAYFNQFGKVHAAIVVRSKKTGRSRGYGFVEFEDEDVAQIAAETMNNYLMYNRVLKCRYIPPEERKQHVYRTSVFSVLPKTKNRKIAYRDKSRALRALDQDSYKKKVEKKINAFKKFFEEKGIDFSFKVNFAKPADNKTDESKNVEPEAPANRISESKDDIDDQFGVLEIDESDNDIHFKTPPKVKKIIKRSKCASPSDTIPNKMQRQVQPEKKLKTSSVSEMRQHKTLKGKKKSNLLGSKTEKITKIRKKPFEESLKSTKVQNKKEKIQKKDSATILRKKKGTVKEKKKLKIKQGK